ncbi:MULTISPECIES: 1,4-alpha-glucan branching protein GlgB [unclassified Nocardioides]|uniref:1,4-alpha-glucan branching protein GlgB n=1 Tax=unclassified Nocardioides TaxID=2615069 RepID=UPI0009F0F4F0|nr:MULTISPECIES: 1,4-alpha-glucan branching protein GlgB [unclassified Nocardioides]GAW50023.1 glycogen branching protein [Nocardioides sp. PD653-B2]GAW55884.1 glycogen branching protein [Nocardioides sp. PD653]
MTPKPTPKPTPATSPALAPASTEELDRLVHGEHGDPHTVLGPHPYDGGLTVRVYKPLATRVSIRWGDDEEAELAHEHEGVWAGVLPLTDVPDYRVSVAYGGDPLLVDDPYRFLPTLGEVDLHLINEGRHEQLWEVLGAHVQHYPGVMGPVTGTSFAVWAPSARAIRLKADFNNWDGREHPMRQLGESGVWELFVPGAGSGSAYKYTILGPDGQWREKADPMAAWAEKPADTASKVFESSYTWNDADWLADRPSKQPVSSPMSVYELHLGSWKKHHDGRYWSWAELADELPAYVADLGFTHVELMPVMQHPFGGSWGYHVTSYFAPDARFGDPDGFRLLVDRLHQAGVGVILDWVPGHFATDEWALARFDGTPLYEDPNPQRGWHKEWGSHIFNFGRREVRNFLYANAIYWLEEFHADGLRVDGVASMLYLDYAREEGEWSPNIHGGHENLEAVQFLQEMNATVYKRVPGITTIAEESTSWPGVTKPTADDGLGFGFKWNMGWMHDSLDYMANDPVHRAYHHGEMTFSLVYQWSENYVLPISHDEVVHGKGSLLRKMPGDRWQQLANLRAYLGFMWAHPGKQLLFMGIELGQESEWAESRELDWWLLDHPEHRGVQSLVRDLNTAYVASPAIWSLDHEPAGFEWIDANDAGRNVFSFIRRGSGGAADLVCVSNFAAVPHDDYRLGLPSAGEWDEVLNTDAEIYAGSGVGNFGLVEAVEGSWSGQPAHATIVVPPLATVWFRKRA